MSFEDTFRKMSTKMDHREIQEEFGVDQEKAVEIHWRVTRAVWTGFQIGAFVMLVVILMVLGGWALWRGVVHR